MIGLSKYVLGTGLLNETLFAGASHSEYLSQIQATYTQECTIDKIGLFSKFYHSERGIDKTRVLFFFPLQCKIVETLAKLPLLTPPNAKSLD